MLAPAYEWKLDHGLCVGVKLPVEHADEALLDAEKAHAATLGDVRRGAWVGGRVAMRLAAARLGLTLPPILADDRGAPVLPRDLSGSISHKDHVAVALLRLDGAGTGGKLGVDVELDRPGKLDISRKVLREEELELLQGLDEPRRSSEVLLRFSAKEAIYKALDPYVRRYVGFTEVSLHVKDDGTALVEAHLSDNEGPFSFEVRWMRAHGLIVTTAWVARRASSPRRRASSGP
ncbi:MAG TPA: 4'-phosphopantetheinyl transferase superfamily protein [Polyangiaceae bacterium]